MNCRPIESSTDITLSRRGLPSPRSMETNVFTLIPERAASVGCDTLRDLRRCLICCPICFVSMLESQYIVILAKVTKKSA